MFKIAKLHPNPDNNGFQILDRRINRPVGEVLRRKEGGYEVYIRGKLIGEASISWQACYIADQYLSKIGSPQKKRKK
jgi:hypothetical protein